MKYKLSDICSGITDGSHNPPAGISKSNYLMLSSKNIFDDEITFDNPRYLSEEQFVVENMRTGIRPGDVLMTIVGTVGRTAIVPDGVFPITLQRSVAVLHPLNDICLSRYLMYVLRSKRKFFEHEAHGVAQKGIYLKQLSNIVVDMPDAIIQQEVVQVLDFVQSVIKKRYEELSKLDDLIKARFVEMFGNGYPEVKLSDVASVTGGLTKNSKRNRLPLKLPYLRVANVAYASIDITEMLEIGLTEEEKEKTLLQYEDLLFVEGNGSPDQIGRVAIWHGEVEPCVHQNHLIKARLNREVITPEYALYYYMSEQGRDQIKNRVVSTSGLYTLSVSKVADFSIPLPEIIFQKRFSSFVQQVDKSKFA